MDADLIFSNGSSGIGIQTRSGTSDRAILISKKEIETPTVSKGKREILSDVLNGENRISWLVNLALNLQQPRDVFAVTGIQHFAIDRQSVSNLDGLATPFRNEASCA